ncbi:helix-turn-helix domain-containing protein [Halomarina litorea]|uniref:helix-turn-helix domain-containing protein n=1 Tax=Halomarina litorea TaxID=2961595 RepID=UPI0020C5988E|nr:helix-turn-helix domain-containing protein [Halomarina sp. BCD28]
MATLITATIPAEEFALAQTLDGVPEATFDCEKLVETGDDSVMPLLWVRAPNFDALDEVLDADDTTRDVTLLTDLGEERLYRMEWVNQIPVVLRMITNSEATILSAATDGDQWVLRVLYPSREGLSDTVEFCEEQGLSFDVRSVRELEGEPAGRHGLTEGQYEALTAAAERGYFAVPREVELADLAEDLDISHQALSERIRRGIESLVVDTLLVGAVRREEQEKAKAR